MNPICICWPLCSLPRDNYPINATKTRRFWNIQMVIIANKRPEHGNRIIELISHFVLIIRPKTHRPRMHVCVRFLFETIDLYRSEIDHRRRWIFEAVIWQLRLPICVIFIRENVQPTHTLFMATNMWKCWNFPHYHSDFNVLITIFFLPFWAILWSTKKKNSSQKWTNETMKRESACAISFTFKWYMATIRKTIERLIIGKQSREKMVRATHANCWIDSGSIGTMQWNTVFCWFYAITCRLWFFVRSGTTFCFHFFFIFFPFFSIFFIFLFYLFPIFFIFLHVSSFFSFFSFFCLNIL